MLQAAEINLPASIVAGTYQYERQQFSDMDLIMMTKLDAVMSFEASQHIASGKASETPPLVTAQTQVKPHIP